MLLVPSATREPTGADDLLRRLATLLPEAWIVAGAVASRPVSDICNRGSTRPFDAIVIGDRMVFVLDIWPWVGLDMDLSTSARFSRFHDKSHRDELWQVFRRDAEKLKAMLHGRFAVEPGRVSPERIWSRVQRLASPEAAAAEDNANIQAFARAARRSDKFCGFPPFAGSTVERIATFLTEEPQPDSTVRPQVLTFTDASAIPALSRQAAAAPAKPQPPSATAPKPAPPVLDAGPPLPKPAPPELLLEQVAPAEPAELLLDQLAPPPRPALRPAPQAPNEAPGAAPPPPTAPSAARPADAPSDRPAVPGPAFVAQPPQASGAPPTAKAPSPPIADHAPLAHAERAQPWPAAPGSRRSAGQWKWAAALLVAVQAGTIGWLSIPDRPTPPAAWTARVAQPVEIPAPVAVAPAPVVVRALADSRPMLVGGEAVRLRSGPGLDFPVVGALEPHTEVTATASAGDLGGATWVEIAAAEGPVGFVPEDGVKPRSARAAEIEDLAPAIEEAAPKAERVAHRLETAVPRVKPAVASKSAPKPKPRAAVASRASATAKDKPALAAKLSPTPKVRRAAASKSAPAVKSRPGLIAEGTPSSKLRPSLAAQRTPSSKPKPGLVAQGTLSSKPKSVLASKRTPPGKADRAARPQRAAMQTSLPPPGITCILPDGDEVQASRSDCRARSGIIYR